jgi:hypothetical protein
MPFLHAAEARTHRSLMRRGGRPCTDWFGSLSDQGRLSGRPFCLPVVDSVLAWSHLIQSQGCERPAVRRHYSFGSALNGAAANPRKLAAMSPRRASRCKSAGEGRLSGRPFFYRTVMNVTVFRAACFTIGHICYVDSPLAVELPNA